MIESFIHGLHPRGSTICLSPIDPAVPLSPQSVVEPPQQLFAGAHPDLVNNLLLISDSASISCVRKYSDVTSRHRTGHPDVQSQALWAWLAGGTVSPTVWTEIQSNSKTSCISEIKSSESVLENAEFRFQFACSVSIQILTA
jgi:hypothetical protein